MSDTRILGRAALALLVIAGACQRRAEGPPDTRTGAMRADTALRDSGLGLGDMDSTARPGAHPNSQPETARRDTATPARRDSGAAGQPSRRARAPKPGNDRTPTARDSAIAPPSGAVPAGSTTTASADRPLRDPYHTAPLDTVDAKTYQGWKYFNLNCARCHGEDVQGTTIAPHLILSLKPDGTIPNEQAFQTTVCGGRVAKGMPAWCSLGLTPAQIDTIYTYVKGRSDAKLHPGRPARRE